jgi:hypothetical protein
VQGSEPARCAAHGGTSARIGAPPGNQHALKHGFYVGRAGEEAPGEVSPGDIPLDRVSPGEVSPGEWSIETVILDLCIKQAGLSRYIEVHSEDLSADELARFLQIHGQNASRLGRLLRDRRALCGEAEGMSAAIARALEELHRELREGRRRPKTKDQTPNPKDQTPTARLQGPRAKAQMTNEQMTNGQTPRAKGQGSNDK